MIYLMILKILVGQYFRNILWIYTWLTNFLSCVKFIPTTQLTGISTFLDAVCTRNELFLIYCSQKSAHHINHTITYHTNFSIVPELSMGISRNTLLNTSTTLSSWHLWSYFVIYWWLTHRWIISNSISVFHSFFCFCFFDYFQYFKRYYYHLIPSYYYTSEWVARYIHAP